MLIRIHPMQTAGLKEGRHPEDLPLGWGGGLLREMDSQRICGGDGVGSRKRERCLHSFEE